MRDTKSRLDAITAPDGRLGWFEGLRDDRFCGWTFHPGVPHRALEVTLSTREGHRLTVRADRYRADLRETGIADCHHGFSAPADQLADIELGVTCTWTDLGLPLPGSPWRPSRAAGSWIRKGSMRLRLDPPLPGDPRLFGIVYDKADPFRRVTVGARCDKNWETTTRATLHRNIGCGAAGDDFHGFVVNLPAPLRMIEHGVSLFDADRSRRIVHLGPRSL